MVGLSVHSRYAVGALDAVKQLPSFGPARSMMERTPLPRFFMALVLTKEIPGALPFCSFIVWTGLELWPKKGLRVDLSMRLLPQPPRASGTARSC